VRSASQTLADDEARQKSERPQGRKAGGRFAFRLQPARPIGLDLFGQESFRFLIDEPTGCAALTPERMLIGLFKDRKAATLAILFHPRHGQDRKANRLMAARSVTSKESPDAENVGADNQ
jgi:hypothetical protein